MKYILIGRGKMGKLIRETASAAGDEIQAAFGHDDLDQLGRLGKVADVVTNNYGTSIPMVDTASVLQRTLEIVKEQETAFICTNVQETDLCGHRENVAAYADRLRVADEWIEIGIRDALGEDDILIVQADHGNDPTIGHPHHTREMVPLMIHSAHSTPKNIGIRKTLSDVGATAADYFHSKAPENGTSFLPLLLK